MTNIQFYPEQDTPKVSDQWKSLTKEQQLQLLEQHLKNISYIKTTIIEIKESGEVTIALDEGLKAFERGTKLLDLEESIKREVDEGLYIMVQPMGDKNALRKLRGINIIKGYEE